MGTVNKFSIPEENVSEIGISDGKERSLPEVGEGGCACWLKNADVELDDDIVLEENDVCVGLDLKLFKWVTEWEKKVDEFFDEFLEWQFRILSTEEVEYELDNGLAKINENVWELISEVVFRSGRFANVDGSSI